MDVAIITVAGLFGEIDSLTEHVALAGVVDIEGLLFVQVDLLGVVCARAVEEVQFVGWEAGELLLVELLLTVFLPQVCILHPG